MRNGALRLTWKLKKLKISITSQMSHIWNLNWNSRVYKEAWLTLGSIIGVHYDILKRKENPCKSSALTKSGRTWAWASVLVWQWAFGPIAHLLVQNRFGFSSWLVMKTSNHILSKMHPRRQRTSQKDIGPNIKLPYLDPLSQMKDLQIFKDLRPKLLSVREGLSWATYLDLLQSFQA